MRPPFPAGRPPLSTRISAGKSTTGSHSGQRRPSILVVDDGRVNRLVLRRMLEDLDVTVETSNDGEEAVRACNNSQTFSAVLMDMCMVRKTKNTTK